MPTSVIDIEPLFEVRAERIVNASPDTVYGIVSDLRRSGEWSPECEGGEWVSGEPAQLGSVFRGRNSRSEDVLAWVPLPRESWITESKVVAADPGRAFHWRMLSGSGDEQDSVWGFDIAPTPDGGCVVAHHFRMGVPTAGVRQTVEGFDEDDRRRFVDEWTAKLHGDFDVVLDRVRRIAESAG